MEKLKKIFITTFSLLFIGSTIFAVNNEAGSSNDPLITKSYLEKVISVLEKRTEELEALVANGDFSGTGSQYEVVTVLAGQSILGKQGTEMIVRSGQGIILDAAGGGLQDMTEGVDIMGGELAPRYHLLIIPREDGRGLLATKELIVMVRGGYTIS
jgi:hypothetical protein